MEEILHSFTGRKLQTTDLYKNYSQLVREATRKFKKVSIDLFNINLRKIEEEDLKDQTIKNGSIVDGIIVLKGTFRKSRHLYSYYMGFNVKEGVLGKPLDVIYTQDLEELPLKKTSAHKLLKKAGQDEIVDREGKIIQKLGIAAAGIKRFFRRGQVDPPPVVDTTRRDIKYTSPRDYPQKELARTVNLPEGRKLEHIPESQMDAATKAKLKEAITALDGLQAKWEPIVKIIEQLSREAGALEKGFGDKMTEIYNLAQKFDVVYELIDSLGTFMEVGIYTSEKERVTQQLTPAALIKELEKVPWIKEKIDEVKTATTITEKLLIPEVKIADKERALERTKSQASEKTAQEKEGTIDKVLDFLKDKVQSLVDAVQSLWQGVTQVKETSIQQSNAPESPVGQPTSSELLTAIMREEIPKPDKSGANMLRWRRQSSKKKVNVKEERTLEAWDRSIIDTEKVKKELE